MADADADAHVAKARAELDTAISKLSDRLADSASRQKQPPPLTWEKLSSSGIESKDDAALISKLVNLSLADYFRSANPDKPIAGKVSSFVSSLLPLTLVALGLVGKAFDASLMGVPVSAITNGTCYIIDLVIKERDRKELFLAKLDHISYQARRVHEIQRYPDTVLLPLLREKALNLLTAITLFLDGAIDYFTRSLVKQITKSVFKGAEAWQKQTTHLQVACEEYDQALLLQVASSILRRSHQNDDVSDAVSAGNDAKIRDWLQPSAAENESRMMANLAQRAQGTLQWVLRMPELRDWRLAENSGEARTFWLTGLPGVGKSCISAYLSDLLPPQYPDDIVLNFFCKRDTPGLNSAFGIIKTLCYQLMKADDFYWKFLQEAPALPKGNTKDDISFLVDKLLRNPINAGPKGKTIFILLDGLDEVEDSGRSSTTKTDVEILLEQMVSLSRVKLLVTSRPLPELDRVLSKSGSTRQIGPADNAEDIENYVAHRVAKSDRLRDGFSGLEVDPIAFFTSRANGIFLWVSVVLDVLERAISTKAFKQSLEEVHPTINSIYDDIFQRAEQRGSLTLIMEILQWTVVVPTPFTVRQMAVAVEMSLGDKVVKMEEFLRTECGAFLALVPRLGSTSGESSSDESLEVTIGHETFQAWLADRLGSEGRQIAHGKAATACLGYLNGDRMHSEPCLRSYALTRWRWHVRHSMDVGDRQFAEPLSVLAGGLPIPSFEFAAGLLLHLYRFLSQQAAEVWIKEEMESESFNHRVFWEVQRTCMEVAAWYKVNKVCITHEGLDGLGLEATEASRLKAWGETLDNPQVIAQMLWPIVCHAWLWNTSARWWGVYWSVEGLHQLYIYAHGRDLFEKNDKTKELLIEEEKVLKANAASTGMRTSGQLHGTLTTHFANVMIKSKELKEDGPDPDAAYECLESIKTAGRYSDFSGVCAANLSIFFYEAWNHKRLPPTEEPLQQALDTIQEAILDDPDVSPGNYYHLAKVYQALRWIPGADKTELARMALEAYRDAVARDPDHLTGARGEVYQAEEDALRNQEPPDLDAAVELLERAIIDDPPNSRNKWYHHLFDIHKERGDLPSARTTYRRLILLDPTWHPKWHAIADTYIDTNLYETHRTFDWPNWCLALLEAIEQDPSYAHSYWDSWRTKANNLLDYGHFHIAIDILQFGIESTVSQSDASASDACAAFYFHAGEAFCKKGDWGEAIPLLEEAFARGERLDIWGKRNTLKWLAWGYMACGRWDDAAAVAEKRLALAPDPIWGDSRRHVAHGWLGEVALYRGEYAAAIKELKTAVRLEEELLGKGDGDKMLSEDMACYLLDLGMVYDLMGRASQAVAVFKKALPHVEFVLGEKIEMRETNDGMWRGEGRWHMLLGWTLERTGVDGVSNPRVLEEYKLAEWVFRKTVYVEDDFVELGDIVAVEEAIKRVEAGQAYTYPDVELLLGERMRLKIGSERSDWGNNYYKDEVQKPRQRGHA